MNKYWLNKNTGDFIIKIANKKFKLILLDKFIDDQFVKSEIRTLTASQFKSMEKDFNLVENTDIKRSLNSYHPLGKNKINIPTISESRNASLEMIGI